MCSHRLDDVQDVCNRIAILHQGELQELGEVKALLRDELRLEMVASGAPLTDELRRDLQDVLRRHGGTLESLDHRSATLEELFVHMVEQSKLHPGRRYLPPETSSKGMDR